ncbi:MAG: hypothetical protein JXR96_03020 [Deltaproteobacteria bacterium]|nr:hypothetical protein [Deltaproteobacteria bacterium]
MKRYTVFFSLALTAAILTAGPARAQDDPLIVKPNVFIIVDTSGSMEYGFQNNYTRNIPCGVDAMCNRMEMIKQVLTGTYRNYTNCNWSNPKNEQCRTCDANDSSVQQPDGILDKYMDDVNFGFAGFTTSNSYSKNHGYRDDYETTYGGDITTSNFDDGLRDRNQSNGGLIDFFDPDHPDDYQSHNLSIQSAICGLSGDQYTPIGPAIDGARNYMKHWQDADNLNYTDPYNECRPKYILLFTDGEENRELGGQDATYWAADIFGDSAVPNDISTKWSGKESGVPVFVVGMDNDGSLEPGLDAIAMAGTGDKYEAFIGTTAPELYAQFDAVMSAILAGVSSRTELTSARSVLTVSESYVYSAHFELTEVGPWLGHLMQQKITDSNDDGIPEFEGSPIDFASKLAAQDPASRKIFTIVEDPRSQDVATPPFREMDEFKPGTAMGTNEALMCLKLGECLPGGGDDDDDCTPLTATELANYIKDFVRGVDGKKDYSRSFTTDGPWLGDIFHSSPVAVPRPTSLGIDYKYEAYFLNNLMRPTMVYVGSNDGMLHAFVGEDPNDPKIYEEGEELWAFVPTNLLATIQEVRRSHEFFVDATPVVRDVYFNDIQETVLDADHNEVELPVRGAYRTILISGQRGGGNSYFALDVTHPDPANVKYLWEYRVDVPVAKNASGDFQFAYTDSAVQCDWSDTSQSWAQPLIGQVWLKTTDPDPQKLYQARSVMIVPGGYVPGRGYEAVASCVDLIEATLGPSSLHIIDMETGKLLRKFSFNQSDEYQNLQTTLENYYLALKDLEEGETASWNHWGVGNAFETDDYDEAEGTGWFCQVNRNMPNKARPPDRLLQDDMCTSCPADFPCPAGVTYSRVCCSNPKTIQVDVTVCEDCDNDGDCGSSYPRCHDHKCHSLQTVCDQPCGHFGDDPCTTCTGWTCDDPATCHEEVDEAHCWTEKQNQVVPSRCSDLDSSAFLDETKLHNGNCSYQHAEYEDGSVYHWLKTEGCWLEPDNDKKGKLSFRIGGKFTVESAATRPVAYNTTLGSFISRVFVGTNTGKIYRIDMANGLYDLSQDEGEMIESYDVDEITYGWDSSIFFDITEVDEPETPTEKIAARPVMAPMSLAMSYEQDLVLFFGTGRTDTLEAYPERDYFLAVKEIKDADGVPTGEGEFFYGKDELDNPTGCGLLKFDENERLYSKPIIVGGTAIITTYTADDDKCDRGSGTIYVFPFSDIPDVPDSAPQKIPVTVTTGGPAQAQLAWTPAGPQVLVQQKEAVGRIDLGNRATEPGHHILNWSKVL